jgi:hypothetical protein
MRMKKRSIAAAAALLLQLSTLGLGESRVHAEEEIPAIQVKINDTVQAFEQPPVLLNGYTMVPLRGIFEALGATVVWHNETRTISAFKDKIRINLGVDKTEAEVSGKSAVLEQPAVIVNGSTMVPARFVSEALGAQVAWDGDTRSVMITLQTAGKGQSSGAGMEAAHETEIRADGSEEYRLPLRLPEIQSQVTPPYEFKQKRDWKMFSTMYFDVYYFSREDEVLRMSPRFDLIYSYLIDRFGITGFQERIPVYFQDEESFSHESTLPWGHASWSPKDDAMFIQLTKDFSMERVLATFKHEMTHAVTISSPESKLRASVFLGEGVAAYYEQTEPHANFTRHQVLYEAFKERSLKTLASIPERNSEWKQEDVPVIYAQAQSFYTYLVETYGESTINNMWFTQGNWKDVLKQITGKTVTELEDAWRSYLQAKYEKNTVTKGVLYYDDGAKYIGELRYGLRHGRGKQYYEGRLLYEGEFADGEFHGKGTYYFKEGGKYEGGWSKGEQEGQAKIYQKDGRLIYDGAIHLGEYHGQGKIYGQDGQLIYEGSFQTGKLHGQGTYYYTGGEKYIGEMKDDKPHGTGKVYDKNGVMLFSGQFMDGKPI